MYPSQAKPMEIPIPIQPPKQDEIQPKAQRTTGPDTLELEKVFKKYDSNGDGKISLSELKNILAALGKDLSKPELRRVMSEMDKNGDGHVDLTEFVEFHGGDGTESEGDLKEAFSVYDRDRNGLISAKELLEVMRKLGEKVSLRDCVGMIKTADRDGDGNVNYEEFVRMMCPDRRQG